MAGQQADPIIRSAGRQQAARKYDLISTLNVMALAAGPVQQRRALRFVTLLTVRCNWASDELPIGRAEIARLWHVTERTVKREMAQFRAAGWLWVKRPALRGRVAVYGVGIERVLRDTAPVWPSIGSDFVARVSAAPEEDAPNVVPFPAAPALPEPCLTSRWARVSADLAAQDAALHKAWFALLAETEGQGGRAELRAPSGFIASYIETHLMPQIRAAYARVAPEVRMIEIVVVP